MKKKWKYDSQSARDNWQLAISKLVQTICWLLIACCLFFLSSCENKDVHKHIPANKTSDLDGLVQPANQTVFSEIKTISPTEQAITPVLNATGVISYDPRM